jgi:hypothetical protein
MYNIGSSILIIGTIYLNRVHGLDNLISIFLCLIGLITWGYIGYTDIRKEYFKLRNRNLSLKNTLLEQRIDRN